MKKLALALLLAAAPAFGNQTLTVLVNAKTTTGASSAIYSTTSTAYGGERWFFACHVVGAAVARLELTLDSGTTWAPAHLFLSPDDLSIQPETGGGRWRVNVIQAPAGSSVTCNVAQSGVLVPTVTP